ncbi:MAG: hypothetical protein IME98_01795 [Proteobacteria bacterium]|nr:hypothetical protein [Pseudomonadota bacterium]
MKSSSRTLLSLILTPYEQYRAILMDSGVAKVSKDSFLKRELKGVL